MSDQKLYLNLLVASIAHCRPELMWFLTFYVQYFLPTPHPPPIWQENEYQVFIWDE